MRSSPIPSRRHDASARTTPPETDDAKDGNIVTDRRVLIIGPTSTPWDAIADEITADLHRLRRPGIELAYRLTAAGPPSIRNAADAAAAAPHVERLAITAASEGFDAVIVDCTDDPGVTAAERAAGIPVIGAGAALRAAISRAPRPVRLFTGDELRELTTDRLLTLARGAATVAIGATGFSHLVERFEALDGVQAVLDPLDIAIEHARHPDPGSRRGREFESPRPDSTGRRCFGPAVKSVTRRHMPRDVC